MEGITFRHQAESGTGFEVSGHYHPKAAIVVANSRVSGRCFVVDDRKLIMPAFGAYTGGLNVLDPAIRGWLSADFDVVMIGRQRVVRMPARKLVA
jgi:metallophosphoesterase superfamily enzyme